MYIYLIFSLYFNLKILKNSFEIDKSTVLINHTNTNEKKTHNIYSQSLYYVHQFPELAFISSQKAL